MLRVDLKLSLAADLPPVLVDHVQIQQVVLNLVRNSLDALDGRGSGAITVATERGGDVVEVAVSDNGPGLPPEVRERVFEPFVSTKPDGIGLSICRTIVEAHGGRIAVTEGWAVQYELLKNGGRQILDFLLPGSTAGFHPEGERHPPPEASTLREHRQATALTWGCGRSGCARRAHHRRRRLTIYLPRHGNRSALRWIPPPGHTAPR